MLEDNLREIRQVKRDWPDRALAVSLMVPCEEKAWKRILRWSRIPCRRYRAELRLPHGMSERGMGSAVGQVPEYVEMVTRGAGALRLPVIVKLTPNVTKHTATGRAARRGGAMQFRWSTRSAPS